MNNDQQAGLLEQRSLGRHGLAGPDCVLAEQLGQIAAFLPGYLHRTTISSTLTCFMATDFCYLHITG